MFNSYAPIENISPAFKKAVKEAKANVEKARENAIASEVVLAEKCAEFGVGLASVRGGRMERVLPSHSIILGDLNMDLTQRGQAVLNAERTLDKVCADALSLHAVRIQVAERLSELSLIITNADGVINSSIAEVSSLEGGLQASRKVQDELRFARGGRSSLVRGHRGSTPPASEVAEKAQAFAVGVYVGSPTTNTVVAEAIETDALAEDCKIVQAEVYGVDKIFKDNDLDNPQLVTKGPRYFLELEFMSARIWPQMQTSDLKSIFRGLANRWDGATISDDINFLTAANICSLTLP